MKKTITITLLLSGIWYLSNSGYMLAKAELSQYLIKDAWQKTLKDKQNHKPWSWADTYPIFEISLPRINKQSTILAGASGRNMAFSAAHLSSSGIPGSNKTTIISGHRDSHFAYLKNVKIGDVINTKTKFDQQSYKVSQLKIIDSTSSKLLIKKEDRLVLTTCYPFDNLFQSGTLRYVVYASPI